MRACPASQLVASTAHCATELLRTPHCTAGTKSVTETKAEETSQIHQGAKSRSDLNPAGVRRGKCQDLITRRSLKDILLQREAQPGAPASRLPSRQQMCSP